ncbi:type IX secretion system protein PorQ [Parabacteroides sp.]
MRNILLVLSLSFFMQLAVAQTGNEVFQFLALPSSARANALGGHTVSLIERDPSLIFHNPALLGGEMDGMVNLDYMNYIADINVGSALFTKAFRDRGAWGVGVHYFHNGKFKGMDEQNQATGDFTANDIAFDGFFSYDLSERWRGGISMKFLYSNYDIYTSLGLGVDAGLSYYNSEKEFSFGVVLKNIGAQLKPYNDDRQKMPWDIQMGISKKMNHAPFRLSVTAMYLNRWKFDYIDKVDPDYKGDNFAKALIKHFVFGVDYIPNDNFWLGVGFNPKTKMDMKLQGGGSGLAGFSAGAGVKIKMFDVGVSFAKYHPSALSMMVSISTTISDFKPL